MQLTPEQLRARILELWREQGEFLLHRAEPKGFPFPFAFNPSIYNPHDPETHHAGTLWFEVLSVDETCLKLAVSGVNHAYGLLVLEMCGFCEHFYDEAWQVTTYYDGAGRVEILLK